MLSNSEKTRILPSTGKKGLLHNNAKSIKHPTHPINQPQNTQPKTTQTKEKTVKNFFLFFAASPLPPVNHALTSKITAPLTFLLLELIIISIVSTRIAQCHPLYPPRLTLLHWKRVLASGGYKFKVRFCSLVISSQPKCHRIIF